MSIDESGVSNCAMSFLENFEGTTRLPSAKADSKAAGFINANVNFTNVL